MDKKVNKKPLLNTRKFIYKEQITCNSYFLLCTVPTRQSVLSTLHYTTNTDFQTV